MPLLNRNNGLIADKTTITTITGTLQLQFTDYSSGSADEVTLVNVNTDKLSKRVFTLPDADTSGDIRYDGFILNGGASAISAATADIEPADAHVIVSGLHDSLTSGSYTIDNGVGKVDLDSTANQSNIKDLSVVHGLVLSDTTLDFQDGAIAFLLGTGTANGIVTEGTTVENDDIAAGTGKALLRDDSVNPAVDKIIILDDLTYPFTVRTGENIEISPIGSALIFTS